MLFSSLPFVHDNELHLSAIPLLGLGLLSLYTISRNLNFHLPQRLSEDQWWEELKDVK